MCFLSAASDLRLSKQAESFELNRFFLTVSLKANHCDQTYQNTFRPQNQLFSDIEENASCVSLINCFHYLLSLHCNFFSKVNNSG